MDMIIDMLTLQDSPDMTVSLFTADSVRKANVSLDFDYMVQAYRINDAVKFEIHKFLAECDSPTPFSIDSFINHLYMKGFDFSEMDIKDYLSNAMIVQFIRQL
ncbi:MAG: hypothetical protein KAH86_06360 [Methanosarcinales archaeon]|nr:hypothetical protein [Methanosarcinales archaeon]